MFWYIFAIVISLLVIVSSIFVKKTSKNAADLYIVEEKFPARGSNGSNGTGNGTGDRDAFRGTGDRDAFGRFCFISDVHISMMPVKWGDVLSAIKNEKAEYVVVTGDLVNKAKDIERAKQFVLTLALGAEIPVIITLGNHDNEVAEKLPGGKQEFIDEFKKLGGDVRVLDDEYTIAGGTLIGGLGDVATGQGREVELVARWAEIAKAEGLEFVLATHNADLFVKPGGLAGKINELAMRPSCVLCGHTHGGQIRLIRHLEFSVIKNDKLPKRGIFYGRHEVEGFDVYITSGLGCSALPLRSGTHPEVVVVILSRM